jgi:hypothetical protein
MNKNNKVIILSLVVYLFIILLFTYFSNTIHFVDAHEYITLTKEFAGIHNVNVFGTHAMIFNLIAAQFLKILPSLFTLKLIGSLWIFLTGLLIFVYSKNKNALFIWMLSPIAWMISIQYNPIIPSTFFLLLGYVLFKRYEQNNSYIYFILSGLASGIAITIYYSTMIIVGFFMLTFMMNKKFYMPLIYSLMIFIALIPEFIINYILFGNPLYSFIRYIGANIVVLINQTAQGDFIHSYWILIPLALTPLLYKLFTLDIKKYKKEIIFLVLSIIFLSLRGGVFKYLYLITPIIILLVSQKISKKELYISSIVSLVLIIILTYGYFGNTFDNKVTKDLERIKLEYPAEQYITSGYQATVLASYSWTDYPKFIWSQEYELQKNNKNITTSYEVRSTPKIASDKILVINFRLEKAHQISFEEPIYLIGVQGDKILDGFVLIKKYDILSIYKKI